MLVQGDSGYNKVRVGLGLALKKTLLIVDDVWSKSLVCLF